MLIEEARLGSVSWCSGSMIDAGGSLVEQVWSSPHVQMWHRKPHFSRVLVVLNFLNRRPQHKELIARPFYCGPQLGMCSEWTRSQVWSSPHWRYQCQVGREWLSVTNTGSKQAASRTVMGTSCGTGLPLHPLCVGRREERSGLCTSPGL